MANLLSLNLVMLVLGSTYGWVSVQQCCPEDEEHVFLKADMVCNASHTLGLRCEYESEVSVLLQSHSKYWFTEDGDSVITTSGDLDVIMLYDSFCVATVVHESTWQVEEGIVFCNEAQLHEVHHIPESLSHVICMLISGICCFITFLIYIMVPSLWKDLLNKCLISILFSNTVMYLVHGVAVFGAQQVPQFCAHHFLLMFFWITASIFWTYVIFFDIWRSAVFTNFPFNEAHLLLVYHFWGWGMPLILSIAGLLFHDLRTEGIGTDCFTNPVHIYAMYAHPAFVLLCISLLYLFWTICKLWKQEPSSLPSNSTRLGISRNKSILHLKVFLVMCIPWINCIMMAHLPGNAFTRIMVSLLAAVHGLLIFLLLVVLRKKALLGLADQFVKIGFPSNFIATNFAAKLYDEDDDHIYCDVLAMDCENSMTTQSDDQDVGAKIYFKEEPLCQYDTSAISEMDAQNDFLMVSVGNCQSDMGNKIEIKKEPLYLDSSIQVKSELDTVVQNTEMQNEVTTCSSHSEASKESSTIQRDDKMVVKIEIKEETRWHEGRSVHCERGTSSASYADLQCVVKDTACCVTGASLTEPSRLYAEETSREQSCIPNSCTSSNSEHLKKVDIDCERTSSSENKDKIATNEQHLLYLEKPPNSNYFKNNTRVSDFKNKSSIDICKVTHNEISKKTFTRSTPLKQHQLINEDKSEHKCDTWEQNFTKGANLEDHNLIHECKRTHKCDVCEKSFTKAANLKVHHLIHEGKRPHKCDICEKSFTLASNLRQHQMIHEGIRPFKCNICEKRFTQASNLKQHQLFHEGKKPHSCDVCEKSFTLASTLKLHHSVHEAKTLYKCDICDKSFNRISTLKQHQIIHESKKPYRCDICEKSFNRESTLKRHQVVHEGKRPHKCDICEKCFARVSTLKQHQMIHGGKRSCKCDICGKCFSRISTLKQHHRKCHTR